MLFSGLARFITRYNKLIIVVWLVALAASYPLFAMTGSVTSGQESLGGGSGDSYIAQKLINTSFSSTGSGQSLFLVISSDNVTSSSVHGFVDSFASAAASDSSLANFTGTGTVYDSVSRVVGGAISAVAPVRNATETLLNLEFRIPSEFVVVWKVYGNTSQTIGTANSTVYRMLPSAITNQTELAIAQRYLSGFVAALSASYQVAPNLPLNARVQDVTSEVAQTLIGEYLPASERVFALEVLRSFTLSNFTDSAAVETFVTQQVPKFTLYTTELAKNVYPLTSDPPGSNKSQLVDEIVTNYTRYGIPTFYQNAITGYVSPNQKVMIVTMSFGSVSAADVKAVRSLISEIAPAYGLNDGVSVTGDEAISQDFIDSSFHDLTLILPITVIILIAATGIFFRSVVTPGISLAGIGIALGIADSAIIYAIGTYTGGIDSNVPNILLTVLIGVGTDYSVFLLARYREERARGADKRVAVEKSVTWAGESIATSGMTVIISFALLGSIQSVSLLRSLGLVVGLGVLVALGASLTLIPSVLLLIPNVVFWPNVGARFQKYALGVERAITGRTSYFSRSARFSLKHAKLIVVLVLVATVPAVYVWTSAPVGYDFLAAAPKSAESVVGFDTISQNFGAGTLYPTYAVLQFKAPVWNGSAYNANEMKLIDSITNTTLGMSNVKSVSGPTRPSGQRVDYLNLGKDPRSTLIEISVNKMISSNGSLALLDIDLLASPQSQTSLVTAQNLRTVYHSFVENDSQYVSAIYLGGAAGSTLDSKNTISSQFDQIILYVMVGVAAVLLIVLGSLFLPLFAILSIVVSIAWTLAATDLVFQNLYSFPILFITPLTLFVLLLGLGMDYNIFILTRIREEATKGASLNDAITTAIERTGGIITAAAIILAGSLGALMISNNLLLKEFGFAFFYSILIDAMVMRTYIVPAVMSLVGKWNWYAPGRLQRVKIADVPRPEAA